MKKIEGLITVEFEREDDAENVFNSMKKETEFKRRSEVKLELTGKVVSVRVKADDLVALRATLNSYSRMLNVMDSVSKL